MILTAAVFLFLYVCAGLIHYTKYEKDIASMENISYNESGEK